MPVIEVVYEATLTLRVTRNVTLPVGLTPGQVEGVLKQWVLEDPPDLQEIDEQDIRDASWDVNSLEEHRGENNLSQYLSEDDVKRYLDGQ